MSRLLRLGAALALLLALAAGWGLTAPVPDPGPKDPRSPQQIDQAQLYLRSLQRQAERPNPDMEELWAAWQRFRVEYPGTPEWVKAAEIMRTVPSPLDKLDRDAIPEEDRPPWLPKEVVAVLGENRGRHWLDVHAVAVSPDGKLVASGAEAVRLWDAATMQERHLFKRSNFKWDSDNWCWTVAFAPKASLLAFGRMGGAELWDLSKGKPKFQALLETDRRSQVVCLSFTGDGRKLLVSPSKGHATLWDVSRDPPKPLRTFYPEEGRDGIEAILSPDGRWLADFCGGAAGSVRLWNLITEKEAPIRLEGSEFPVAFSPDGKTFAAAVPSLRITRLWDVSGKAPDPIRDLSANAVPHAVAFAPDGATLACLDDDKTLRLWPLNDAKRKEWRLPPPQSHVPFGLGVLGKAAAFFPDGKTLALGCEDGTVRLWDVAKGAERFVPKGNCGPVNEAAFSPDCKTLATAGEDRSLRLWDLAGTKPVERVVLAGQPGPVDGVAFAPRGRYLVSQTRPQARKERTLHFWDVSGPQPKEFVPVRPRTSDREIGFSFSADGKRFACRGEDDRERTLEDPRFMVSNVRLYDFDGGRLEERATIIPEPARDEAGDSHPLALLNDFAPDGRRAVIRTLECWRLWSLDGPTPKELCAKKFDRATPGGAVFSPDGKLLASFDSEMDAPPGERKTAQDYLPIYGVWLWNVTSDGVKERGHFKMTNSPPLYLFFLPDAKTLVTIDDDHRLDFWDVETGRKLREIRLPGPARPSLAPDGRHIALANTNGTVYILRIAPPGGPRRGTVSPP